MSGNGSFNSPWDLATVINNPIWLEYSLLESRTVWLRGGTYTGDYTNATNGVDGRNIVFRGYPGEIAVIDGNFDVNGSYVTFQDLIFTYSGWSTRETDSPASQNLNIRGTYLKFINCIIHDLSSPVIGQEALSCEFYGCLSYNNGWLGTDRGHGHGVYCQNANGSPQMIVKDSIFCNNFGWGPHAYAGNGVNLLYNILMEGNTSFKAGSLSGTARPNFLLGADSGQSTGCSIKSNMSYDGECGLEFYGAGAALVEYTNNYFPDGKQEGFGSYTAETESGNYYGTDTGNTHFLRANQYDNNRANLTIYNQAQSDSLQIDVSSVLNVGDTVNAHNAENYFTDIQALTVAGDGTITVDMRAISHAPIAPVQWVAPATAFPNFGCFILERA